MNEEIRILLIDDHSLFRESLSRLLDAERDFRVVGSCRSAAEALKILDRDRADIVLLDYELGQETGVAFLQQARGRGFGGRVLMVTAGMSDTEALRALESGACGIFLKHSAPAELIEAIRRVINGDMWLDPKAVRAVVAGAEDKTGQQRAAQPFTSRERAVLKGVFEGLTNKEIGARLDISESSVKAVMQQLFDKTGVRTRSQLVRIALERREDWSRD
jgi:DNA-binding NarL/FixJ family response regulator